ncbi:MAG: L,D-transpeptidase [Candidatus Harrisonbacteria bacterium]|nr:L,D-transpeptidase [Candidatus Harrisonbacteria bacterium]
MIGLLLFLFFIPTFATETPQVSTSIPYQEIKLKNNDTLLGLFGKNWELVARFNRMDEKHLIGGHKLKVPNDLEALKNWTPMPREYPPAASHKKYFLILLDEQFLGTYEYGKLILDMPISSGRPPERCDAPNGDCSTPKGLFQALGGDWNHTSTLYDDPSGNPYPMKWAIRFHINKDWVQYWIHGGDLPGYQASHGCIRVIPKDALKLFRWVFPKAPKREFWLKKGTGIPIEIK